MPDNSSGQPPLQGLRVVEFATVIAGPGAAMYLADQGADVVKVESLVGDPLRRLALAGKATAKRATPAVSTLNHNKRSVSLNLRSPEGKEIAELLVARADVVIENFRPGALERLGLSYESQREKNPGLVWASISGFDPSGPYRDRRGYDQIAQAYGGSFSYRQWPDGSPMYSGLAIGDVGSTMLTVYGITLALLKRAETGRGQRVSANLLNTVIAMQGPRFFLSESTSEPMYRERRVPWTAPYRCSDGKYLWVALLTDTEWAELCRALELGHVLDDPRYAFPAEDAAAQELSHLLAGIFETRPRDEWIAYLVELDVPVAPVNTLSEVITDPHLRESAMAVPIDHPTEGRLWVAGVPVRLSDNPPRSHIEPGPALGQHTAEVLQELGYAQTEIDALSDKEVILLHSAF